MRVPVLVFTIIFFCCLYAGKEISAEDQDADLLYRAKCASCHRVYTTKKYTYQKFQAYIIKYGRGLNDEERRRLLEYLKENAKQE